MTNIMRRHGKVLMTILTAGLMLVWVIQATVGRNQDRSGQMEKGKLNGKAVVGNDLGQASRDLGILRAMGVQIPAPPPTDENDQVLQVFLLQKEAEKYGITITDEEVGRLLGSLSESQLKMIMARSGAREREIHDALRTYLTIASLERMSEGAAETSLPRVELEADKLLSTADVTVATIDGVKDWEKSPAPTEEQIKKQFDLYKGILPTGPDSYVPPQEVNGHHYPFGYKYPDRAKVEYLQFDRAELARQFTLNEEDVDAAFKYYSEHPDDPRFAPKASATQASGGATKPGIRSWNDVKDELIKDEVAKRVDKLMKKVVDRARTLAEEPWKRAETEGGYKKLLPQDQWADYQKIADEIQRNKEYGGFKPSYHAVTGLLGEAELAKLKGIGGAYYESQSRQRPFSVLATHVKELVGTKDPMADLFVEVGPEGPTLRDDAGDYYIYRVTAAEKSREPERMDEVRGQIVDDLKKVAAYEKALGVAKDLAQKGKAGDLLGLARSSGLDVDQINDVSQESPVVGKKIGYVPGMVEAIFAMTREPAATQPEQGGKRVSPTTSVSKDESFKIYVMELARYHPVTSAMFAARRYQVVQRSEFDDRRAFVMSWMSLPAIMERMHFVPAAGSMKSSKETE